ncbi:MAG: hypothetical protein Q8M47_00730, partial [Devosia sp.]|nr:hypothetical protein [Devosia sp.]
APVCRQQSFGDRNPRTVSQAVEGAVPVQHNDAVALRQQPLQRIDKDVQVAVEAVGRRIINDVLAEREDAA